MKLKEIKVKAGGYMSFAAVIGLLVFGLSISASAAQDQKAHAFVLCKNQKNVRTIRVTPDESTKGCTTTYSKAGVDEIVGTNRSIESCKNVLNSIKANLEKSRWVCRNVDQAMMTTSNEALKQ